MLHCPASLCDESFEGLQGAGTGGNLDVGVRCTYKLRIAGDASNKKGIGRRTGVKCAQVCDDLVVGAVFEETSFRGDGADSIGGV